ncbi:response regulator [Spirosoma pollinicola]|uniref:Response regulator n=1 Tax=Spirosoma pollinicola TaxID=2057025 RepID=A0A2K8ZA80_9BACT|nr:response regulator [Spirosoma pollinicola]AUD06782.1 response regulator [Spirosoma pollinicola]
MLPDYLSSRRNKSVPVLVIEDNTDHQLLIGYSLKAKVPRANPIFAQTAQEALRHLQSTCTDLGTFPQLVLLDLFLPDLAKGWALLTDLKKGYPLLPIVVFSSSKDIGIVRQAYELGAHSFLSKPSSLDDWESTFQTLNEYWFNIASLPSRSY